MTYEEEARLLFRGKDRLNCAQAVAKAFQKELNISDEVIAELAGAGGGRAEGGVCGAYHALKLIVSDGKLLAELESAFVAEAGTLKCREIKGLQKIDCRSCVGLAARILADNSPALRK